MNHIAELFRERAEQASSWAQDFGLDTPDGQQLIAEAERWIAAADKLEQPNNNYIRQHVSEPEAGSIPRDEQV